MTYEEIESYAIMHILESDSTEAFEKMQQWIEGALWMQQQVKNNVALADVSKSVCNDYFPSFDEINKCLHCGLSESEYKEREILLKLQKNSRRWFSKEEFDRLKELSNKMFANAGSPHSA